MRLSFPHPLLVVLYEAVILIVIACSKYRRSEVSWVFSSSLAGKWMGDVPSFRWLDVHDTVRETRLCIIYSILLSSFQIERKHTRRVRFDDII